MPGQSKCDLLRTKWNCGTVCVRTAHVTCQLTATYTAPICIPTVTLTTHTYVNHFTLMKTAAVSYETSVQNYTAVQTLNIVIFVLKTLRPSNVTFQPSLPPLVISTLQVQVTAALAQSVLRLRYGLDGPGFQSQQGQ